VLETALVRQEDWGHVTLHVLACSWRTVSSHGGSVSSPGRLQTSRVREGSLLIKATPR
jgi:hypothetical protein